MVYLQVKRELNVPSGGVSGAAEDVPFAHLSFPFRLLGCVRIVSVSAVMPFRHAHYISFDVTLPFVWSAGCFPAWAG